MRIIRNDYSLDYSINSIKEELIETKALGEETLNLDSFYLDFMQIIRAIQGEEAISKMDAEITKRMTEKQQSEIKVLKRKVNRLETEIDILKGNPQPMSSDEGVG